MRKINVLFNVSEQYEIGTSVVAANFNDNIIPLPSPKYYTIKEIIKDKRLEYNKGVFDPKTQTLEEFEKELVNLGIPFASNEVLLDVIAEMKKKGIFK